MGIADLRATFNDACAGQVTCTKATMNYVQQGGTEWQVLCFWGSYANGEPFEIKSDRIRPSGSLLAASKDTAATLLAKGAPK